ncbi:hypothetical protein OTSKARP_0375 [Orientia tsutsugamushi str. Karp]|nr:hypothetical protein OTSKARP_0375 [Orientia tsutsugamushi str. Karp]
MWPRVLLPLDVLMHYLKGDETGIYVISISIFKTTVLL